MQIFFVGMLEKYRIALGMQTMVTEKWCAFRHLPLAM